EIDAELEEAMRVQRQRGAALAAVARGVALDRVVVGDEGGKAALADPAQQPLVAAVEDGAGNGEALGVGSALHLEDEIVEAGAQADEVARLDDDRILRHHPHQLVIADPLPRAPEMGEEVDHYGAPLDAAPRHVL